MNAPNPLPPTHIISGANGLYTPALTSELQNRLQSTPIPITTSERVGLMYQVQTGLKYDRQAYQVQAWIKSVLGPAKEVITDKGQLYKAMAKIGAEQYLAPTRPLGEVLSVRRGEILIAKPIGNRTGGGRGNQILKSTAELEQVKKTYRQQRLQGIVSTYLANPWLHNGRKFHLRLYFLVRAGTPDGSLPYFSELWSEGKIITAAEPYRQDAYDRPEIHDTHMKSTLDDYSFPQELQIPPGIDRDEALTSIRAQLDAIGQSLGQIMVENAQPLPEAYFGFEIFGLDLMIQTESGQPRVFLLEANTRVAYGPVGGQKEQILAQTGRPFDPETGPWTPEYILFSERYFEWMAARAVVPFYEVYGRELGVTRTFRISGGTGLLHPYLQYILEANGFKAATGLEHTGYLHLEKLCEDLKSYDKAVETLPCDLKSILSAEKRVIADKELLHAGLQASFPEIATQHLASTWNLKRVPKAAQSKVLILRPVGAGASCGSGIEISTNPDEFKDASRRVLNQSRALRIKSVIASEYITNPLLTQDGRKFHLRMFLLVRVGPGWPETFTYDLWRRGRVVTAALPYQAGDWHNKRIHDTHAESTDFNLWFPEDLPDPAHRYELLSQMETIAGAAVSLMYAAKVGPYPESRNAFEVFGCDFMITDDYRVILIEINDRVGYANLSDRVERGIPYPLNELTQSYYPEGAYTFADFSYDYFSWLFAKVIGPLFLQDKAWTELRLPSFGFEAEPTAPSQPTSQTSIQSLGFDSNETQTFFEAILIQIKNLDLGQPYSELVRVAPISMQEELQIEYEALFSTEPDRIWALTTREIGLALLQTGALFVSDNQITVAAIQTSYDLLYTQAVWARPDRAVIQTFEASSQFNLPGVGRLQISYGESDRNFLAEILKIRLAVWQKVRTTKRSISDWAEALDQNSIHLGIWIGNKLGAVSRLSFYRTWAETSESRWFNQLTEPVLGPVAIIGRLGVLETFQGQGLGKYLDLVCIEAARRLRFRSVFCDVPPYRVEPLQRMGFRVIMAPKWSRNFPDLTWTAMKYDL